MATKTAEKTQDGIQTLLTRAETAAYLKVTPRTLQRWEEQQILTAIKLTRQVVRYRLADVQRLIQGAS